MTDFIAYNPKYFSGMPKDLTTEDMVEVIFREDTADDRPYLDKAGSFGWNKTDILSYRKVS